MTDFDFMLHAIAEAEKAAAEAYLAAGMRFGFADPKNSIPTTSAIAKIDPANAAAELPESKIPRSEAAAENGLMVAKLLMLAGLCKSNSDGRRLIQGGAVSINDVKVTDVNAVVREADFAGDGMVLRAGKKNFRKVTIE